MKQTKPAQATELRSLSPVFAGQAVGEGTNAGSGSRVHVAGERRSLLPHRQRSSRSAPAHARRGSACFIQSKGWRLAARGLGFRPSIFACGCRPSACRRRGPRGSRSRVQQWAAISIRSGGIGQVGGTATHQQPRPGDGLSEERAGEQRVEPDKRRRVRWTPLAG